VSYAVSGLPGATLDSDTLIFHWTPGFTDAGPHAVTFTATDDGDGTGTPQVTTQTVHLTVLNVNRAPKVTFIPNQTVDHDTILEVPVTAVDPDGDPMGLSVVGLPAFGTFVDNGDGTGRFTFSPHADDRGNYTMSFTATDNGDGDGPGAVLSGSQSFVLTVNTPNLPPHLAPIGTKVAVVGQPMQLALKASDGDQDPLTFSAVGLPAGATLSPGTAYGQAVITWTPAAADVGKYTMLVTVADNGNGTPATCYATSRRSR